MFNIWRVRWQILYRKLALLQASLLGKMKISSSHKNNRVDNNNNQTLRRIWEERSKRDDDREPSGSTAGVRPPQRPALPSTSIITFLGTHTHTHTVVTGGSNAELNVFSSPFCLGLSQGELGQPGQTRPKTAHSEREERGWWMSRWAKRETDRTDRHLGWRRLTFSQRSAIKPALH